MFDDEDGHGDAERKGDDLAPETRDLAAEVTPAVAESDDDPVDGIEDSLEGDLLESHDEAVAADVDGETATAFWAAVVYVNVGLLLVALGPMLVVFRGRTQVGLLLVGLGGFAIYRAYNVYLGYAAEDATDDDDGERDPAEKD